MRQWTYSWNSSDGLRHEGEIRAPSKDDAYAELRKRGIRPIRVTERIRPVVRNGLSGLRKSDWSLILLAFLFASVLAVLGARRYLTAGSGGVFAPASGMPGLQSLPRHWVEMPDDPVIEKSFAYPHERFLARYAIPARATSPDATPANGAALLQDFRKHLAVPVAANADDAPNVVELKRIVMGMKEDAKKYLAMSGGLDRLVLALEERQKMEIDYRADFIRKVERGELSKDAVNESFRAMGIRELP